MYWSIVSSDADTKRVCSGEERVALEGEALIFLVNLHSDHHL